MITHTDIRNYFDQEALTNKENWEKQMEINLTGRIKNRRAIAGLDFVKEVGQTDEGDRLLKYRCDENLSDFKEGDALVLHPNDIHRGVDCQLYETGDDNTVVLQFFPPNVSKIQGDKNLVLDKAVLDLRQRIFSPFCDELDNLYSEAQTKGIDDFWEKHLLNDSHAPVMDDVEQYADVLNEIIKSFGFEFTPSQGEAILNSLAAKDYYLIQGPPGTGKSFVLGVIILAEMICFKRKVVVIGPNHKAINNVLEQVIQTFPIMVNVTFKVGQYFNAPMKEVMCDGQMRRIKNIGRLNVSAFTALEDPLLVGLTPHALYTKRARGLRCDTLIIDEAGQMSIPWAMMGMIRTDKIIFSGDHKQLPPIIQSDKIPDELKQSIFQKLLTEENCTLLDTSFRMCKSICEFVSDIFYEGKLYAKNPHSSEKVQSNDKLYSFDYPVVLYNVEDDGQQYSDGEAREIVKIIENFVKFGVPAENIGVLAPFRAQVVRIRRLLRNSKRSPTDQESETLSEEQKRNVVIDTIDKMQGQERDVIIFSMVAGKPDYMNEMSDFLFSPNKLNVAFSRAKSKLIIVGNLTVMRKLSGVKFPHIGKIFEHKNATLL